MDKKIKLKIITQQKIVFEDDVKAFYTKAIDGAIGILPNHTPLITALDVGVTKAVTDKENVFITTMGGILQFRENEAVILTDVAELGTDIDKARAKNAYERAKARLNAHTENVEIVRAQLALARALARMNAANKGM